MCKCVISPYACMGMNQQFGGVIWCFHVMRCGSLRDVICDIKGLTEGGGGCLSYNKSAHVPCKDATKQGPGAILSKAQNVVPST